MFRAVSFIKVLNQKLPVSIISRMEKLNMACVGNRIILTNKKRTHDNMDESHRHNDKQKKPKK